MPGVDFKVLSHCYDQNMKRAASLILVAITSLLLVHCAKPYEAPALAPVADVNVQVDT